MKNLHSSAAMLLAADRRSTVKARYLPEPPSETSPVNKKLS
jgi:hypothetical protein